MGITIKQLANELHLSPSTISRALRDDHTISLQTKKKVLALARKRDYQPNPYAWMLRKQSSKTIAVLVPDSSIPFFNQVITGVEEEAKRKGFRVLVGQTKDSYYSEKEWVASPLVRQAEGLIVAFSKDTPDFDHFVTLQKMGIPLVFFDRMCEKMRTSTVITDDYSGAWDATLHLAQEGCTKIAFIGTDDPFIFNQAREDGYADALGHLNLNYHTARVYKCSSSSMQDGREAGEALLSLPPDIRPDAIFATDDYLALGCIQVAQEMGLAIPDELAIVGYGNAPFGAWLSPSLSTINQSSKRVGSTAMHFLFQQIEKPSSDTQVSVIDTNLIVRASSKRKKDKR